VLKPEEQKEPGLKRSINLFQAVMYGVGLILGAGIYVLIGDAAGIAGNAMWMSFVIAAVIAAFTGLSYAELSSMFPKSAAEYVFVKNAFKNNLAAFVTGWLITFVAVASAAAVAIGFSSYLTVFFPQSDPLLSAVALIMALSAINFIGIRESAWMNTTFTFIELAGLAIVVLAAVLLGSLSQADYYELPPAASGSLSLSIGAIVGAAGLIFFAYFGFENLANIAEETKNAPRTIPRALVISIAITTGIYILIAVSAVALVGWESLSSSDAPLAQATEKAFGRTGVTVLTAIALFATSNTVLMMLVAGSRIMFGMSRERALPAALGRVHSATKTPWIAVALMMLLTVALVALFRGSISAVANIAVFSIFMVYVAVNLSLIWLRYRQPQLERPFRSPVRIGWFPLLAGLGFVTSLAMLTQFDSVTVMSGAAAVAIGLASYAAIAKIKAIH
jgi:APA family basic amino acid/polyamine antiporter